jgi:putative DNA primase/helicase
VTDLDRVHAARELANTHNRRDPDGALAVAQRREPIPYGWHDLEWIAQTDRRDAIRIYARLGLHPIAVHGLAGDACTCGRADCQARGKHPVLPRWQREPLDLDTLDAMLLTNWRYNIGLRTGTQPNGRFLVVVDVDGPRSFLEPLEVEHGAFPATLTARTGRGGLHLFYWVRPGVEVSNRAGIVPKVDIRGSGGQVVAAPSRHLSGNSYQWVDCREPEVLP